MQSIEEPLYQCVRDTGIDASRSGDDSPAAEDDFKNGLLSGLVVDFVILCAFFIW
jgi:hypothetical protein